MASPRGGAHAVCLAINELPPLVFGPTAVVGVGESCGLLARIGSGNAGAHGGVL